MRNHCDTISIQEFDEELKVQQMPFWFQHPIGMDMQDVGFNAGLVVRFRMSYSSGMLFHDDSQLWL